MECQEWGVCSRNLYSIVHCYAQVGRDDFKYPYIINNIYLDFLCLPVTTKKYINSLNSCSLRGNFWARTAWSHWFEEFSPFAGQFPSAWEMTGRWHTRNVSGEGSYSIRSGFYLPASYFTCPPTFFFFFIKWHDFIL